MPSNSLPVEFAPVTAVRDLLTELRVPWWIAGGWAIDLALGQVSRAHHDVDVLMLERDEHALRDVTDVDLRLVVGADEREKTWPPGRRLIAGAHRIQVRAGGLPLPTEVLLGAAVGSTWLYHRGRMGAVTRPLAAITRKRGDIPYLSPEVVLAMKAVSGRAKDAADFDAALPLLDADQRRWLGDAAGRRWRSTHASSDDSAVHPWTKRLSITD